MSALTTIPPNAASGKGDALLVAPPVYRRTLAGGTRPLRLGWPRMLILAGAAGAFGLATIALGGLDHGGWTNAAGGVPAAVLTAAIATRWVGREIGLLAGLVVGANAGTLLASVNPWLAAAAAVGIGLLAIGNTPGRLPLGDRRAAGVGFFAILAIWVLAREPAEPLTILLVGLAYLAVTHDTRGLGRLMWSAGPPLLAAAIGLWWIANRGGWIGIGSPQATAMLFGWSVGAGNGLGAAAWTVAAMLPWSPIILLAIWVGWRHGHQAHPFWRLMGCWAVVPPSMAAVGIVDARAAGSLALPAMAILSAGGIWIVWVRVPRYWAER